MHTDIYNYCIHMYSTFNGQHRLVSSFLPRTVCYTFASQHACYSCPNESCARGDREENRYIRLHVAGASEAMTISSGDFTCYNCGTQLVENVSLRTLASKSF